MGISPNNIFSSVLLNLVLNYSNSRASVIPYGKILLIVPSLAGAPLYSGNQWLLEWLFGAFWHMGTDWGSTEAALSCVGGGAGFRVKVGKMQHRSGTKHSTAKPKNWDLYI